MKKVILVVVILCSVMSVCSVVAAGHVYIDDGRSHIIDDSTHVNDTLWLDYYSDNTPGTHIEMVDGGEVAFFLPFNNSTITIHGGTVDRGNVAIDTQGDNLVMINGGTFTGDIASNNNSRIYVNGGTFNDDLYAYDTGIVEILGGSIHGILGVFNSGKIHLIGSNFKVDGKAFNQGDSIRDFATLSTIQSGFYSGTITGTLLNGTEVNYEFWVSRMGDSDIITFPEPTNHPPVANAGNDREVYACINSTAEVTLDGSGSNDINGDELIYYWSWMIDDEIYNASGVTLAIELPVGEHTIQLIVSDGVEDSVPDEVVVTVIDSKELLSLLADYIVAMELPSGIENRLLGKIDTAIGKLEDDKAVTNSIRAFINAVQAQSGKKISQDDADYLIETAQQAVDILCKG